LNPDRPPSAVMETLLQTASETDWSLAWVLDVDEL